MSKFTFICEEEPMPFVASVVTKRTVEVRADSLDDILIEFENFLRGCGFHFEGNVIIDQETWPVEEANRMIDDYRMSESENAN
jgi:hypothetical protein